MPSITAKKNLASQHKPRRMRGAPRRRLARSRNSLRLTRMRSSLLMGLSATIDSLNRQRRRDKRIIFPYIHDRIRPTAVTSLPPQERLRQIPIPVFWPAALVKRFGHRRAVIEVNRRPQMLASARILPRMLVRRESLAEPPPRRQHPRMIAPHPARRQRSHPI